MIIIIFGLAAAGKTFVGNIIGKHFDFYFEDADAWLSSDMKEYVKDQKHFTLDMLDNFTRKIIHNIERLNQKFTNIAISQALYRSNNRDTIQKYFEDKGIKTLFLNIDAPDQVIYDRLISRGDWILPSYAKSMRKFFQPMDEAIIINNEKPGEENILKQLYKIDEITKNKKK